MPHLLATLASQPASQPTNQLASCLATYLLPSIILKLCCSNASLLFREEKTTVKCLSIVYLESYLGFNERPPCYER